MTVINYAPKWNLFADGAGFGKTNVSVPHDRP